MAVVISRRLEEPGQYLTRPMAMAWCVHGRSLPYINDKSIYLSPLLQRDTLATPFCVGAGAARRRQMRSDPALCRGCGQIATAASRSWSAASNAGSTPTSGRSRSGSDCPKSPSRSVPLDADAALDLQTVLHRIYDDAGYGDYIYEGTPRPKLDDQAADWAREFVPQSTS